MILKRLMMGVILISIPLSAGAVESFDGCEAGLVTDPYYSVFIKGLALGALGDEELSKALASEVPLNPLASVRPDTRNFSTKQALEIWMRNPRTLVAWPTTRKRLQDLLETRTQRDAVRGQAVHDTRLVLAPQEYLGLASEAAYASAPQVLDNGTPVLAYFANGNHVAVVRLTDKAVILNHPLPAEMSEAQSRHLTWYRDGEGKLWLYVSLSQKGFAAVYRQAWGSSEWEALALGLSPEQTAANIVSGGPGILLLQVRSAEQGASVVNIASGQPILVPEVQGLNPGEFEVQGGQILAPKPAKWRERAGIYRDREGQIVKVLAVGRGDGLIERFLKKPGTLKVEWRGKVENIPLPKNKSTWFQRIDFSPTVGGRQLLAVAHHSLYSSTGSIFISVWELGSFKQPLWTYDLGAVYHVSGLHWFEGRNGEPLLAVDTDDRENARLHILSLDERSEILDVVLPAPSKQWFVLDGRTFFTIPTRHKLSLFVPLSDSRGR